MCFVLLFSLIPTIVFGFVIFCLVQKILCLLSVYLFVIFNSMYIVIIWRYGQQTTLV